MTTSRPLPRYPVRVVAGQESRTIYSRLTNVDRAALHNRSVWNESPRIVLSLAERKAEELLPSIGVKSVMRCLTFWLLVLPIVAAAQDWGPPVNGVRLALAVEEENVVVTFQNILVDRDMYLPLGRAIGIGRAEYVEIQLVLGDGRTTN